MKYMTFIITTSFQIVQIYIPADSARIPPKIIPVDITTTELTTQNMFELEKMGIKSKTPGS